MKLKILHHTESILSAKEQYEKGKRYDVGMGVNSLNSDIPFVPNVSRRIILLCLIIKQDESVFVHYESRPCKLDCYVSEWNVLVKNAYVTAKECLTKATAIRG